MKYPIEGAIFDMDGTLLDSMAEWHMLRVRFMERRGLVADEAFSIRLLSMTLQQSAAYIKEYFSLPDPIESIQEGFRSVVREFYATPLSPKPGAIDFLAHLKACGVPCCVASATDLDLAEFALEQSGLRPYLDAVFSTKDIGRSKKYPDIYEHARAYMGTDRARTWVFEDAAYALATAANAGFPTVGVYDPYEKQQDEMQARATILFPDFSAYPDYFA